MGNKETSRFTTICPVEKASERTDRRPTVCASHLREALPFASGFVTRGRGVTLFPLQCRMRGSDMGPGLVQVPGRPGVGFLTGLCLKLVIFLSPLNYCSWLRDLSVDSPSGDSERKYSISAYFALPTCLFPAKSIHLWKCRTRRRDRLICGHVGLSRL